jgi:hypothetical protein
MTSAKNLLACGAAVAALAFQACSDSSDSTETQGAAGEDSGAPDQTAEAAPDAAQESTQEASVPEAGADGPLPDVIEGDALPPEKICGESEPGFDEGNPGINFDFSVGTTVMMGTEVGLAVGSFMKTGREDYCKPAKGLDIAVGTCTTMAAPGVIPQCANDSECAPEQKCLADTNQNGQPISGTENCKTPRSPLDVGPFTLSGFAKGPKTFDYNAQQKGAYTSTDSQDGQIPPVEFGYDVDYTFGGTLDGDAGLGAIGGMFHLPAKIAWSSPPLVDLPGMPGVTGIEATEGQDLVLQWTGGAPDGVIKLTMTGGPKLGGATITCKTANNGTFTIPGALITAVKLGPNAFVNMLQIEFASAGATVTGPGITRSRVGILQTLLLNVIKK